MSEPPSRASPYWTGGRAADALSGGGPAEDIDLNMERRVDDPGRAGAGPSRFAHVRRAAQSTNSPR